MSTEVKTVAIEVDTANIELMLSGIETMCTGLCREIFGYTENGVLQHGEGDSKDNAENWILQFYEVASGAFATIGGAMGFLSQGLVNGDIEIIPGERGKGTIYR